MAHDIDTIKRTGALRVIVEIIIRFRFDGLRNAPAGGVRGASACLY
jgi:hypothetical protein